MIYNTDILPILISRDPKLLPVGKRIMIPRSPRGYDEWIITLKKLIGNMEGGLNIELERLNEIEANAGESYVKLDLLGDVVSLFASLTIKAGLAGKAAAVAYKTEVAEEPLINALHYSWAQTDEFAFHMMAFFEKIEAASQKAFRKAGFEKLFDKVAGKNAAMARKIIKAVSTTADGNLKLKFSREALADASLAVLERIDSLNPFKVSNHIHMWMWILGQTLEGTLADQRKQLKSNYESWMATCKNKIRSVAIEKKLVWG